MSQCARSEGSKARRFIMDTNAEILTHKLEGPSEKRGGVLFRETNYDWNELLSLSKGKDCWVVGDDKSFFTYNAVEGEKKRGERVRRERRVSGSIQIYCHVGS